MTDPSLTDVEQFKLMKRRKRSMVRISIYLGVPLVCGLILYNLVKGNYFAALLNWTMLLIVIFLGFVIRKRTDERFEYKIYSVLFRLFTAAIGIALLYEIGFQSNFSRIGWCYIYPILVFFAVGFTEGMIWVSIFYGILAFFILNLDLQQIPLSEIQGLKSRFLISFFVVCVLSVFLEHGFRHAQEKLLNHQRHLEESENRYRQAYEQLITQMQERKQAEQALRESEDRYRDLVECSQYLICTHDLQGQILSVNQEGARLLGYNKTDLVGKNIRDLVGPKFGDEFATYLDTIQKHRVAKGLIQIRTAAGELRIWEYHNTLRTEGVASPVVRAIAHDITERKGVERALREKTEELARSNEDLEQFAYVASHDLQEPLRTVTSYVQLLARRYKGKLDADADEFIGFAADGAVRMWNLVNDLLTYSRVGMQRNEFEPADSEAALAQSVNDLKVAIEETGALVTHDPLPTVMADPPQLGQLFRNLIGNAIKFRSSEPPRVHISASRTGNGWTFSVRDNGIGIAQDYSERIFVIFQRLHNREEYAGTGIGLAVCKKIVERHGGRIWVKSDAGKGATFYFILPAVKAELVSSGPLKGTIPDKTPTH
ncbi:MAG: multi-sensor signal transduction histidine kinase [Deltaproteobacteria bacterium]|jgi:PAS domain S-box-containing protein|nr:multi-sensor signal transduction histidine kinase [Deltaproteobacteria bacterium]